MARMGCARTHHARTRQVYGMQGGTHAHASCPRAFNAFSPRQRQVKPTSALVQVDQTVGLPMQLLMVFLVAVRV